MERQSISITEANEEWLKSMIDSKEYTSKSEIINDLIRQARKRTLEEEWIRKKIVEAENSGYVITNKEELLNESKTLYNEKL